MKRRTNHTYHASMEDLCFSKEAKENMVHKLMQKQKEQNMYRNNRKKLTLIAVAATLILATMTGAAVFTRWSKTAQIRYNPSEDIKEQAKDSGLSVLLEENKGNENPEGILSVTDQGITITAVQTIVDNYQAWITFRIEGFELPEDEWPAVWPTVTIDGDQFFGGLQSGDFYNGLTQNEKGETVYAATGLPVKSDADGCLIMDPVAQDGSLEYTHFISFEQTDGRYMGKEIVFTFDSIDFQSHQKAGTPVPQVEGNWQLKWTLTGTDNSIQVSPNAPIGDSGVILLDAEVGQISLRTRYQLKDYWEGWDELAEFPQAVWGVRMKDGTEYRCYGGSSGFEDQNNMIYYVESRMYDILDISQVESLMFRTHYDTDEHGYPVNQTFCYIPVS